MMQTLKLALCGALLLALPACPIQGQERPDHVELSSFDGIRSLEDTLNRA